MYPEEDLIISTLESAGILGIDEAGRGPLAGPVYAAAVVIGQDFPVSCLDDSKRLTAAERLEAEILIKKHARAWAIAFATHVEIDRMNILNATMLAMRRAALKVPPELFTSVLVDGNRVPDLGFEDRIVMPVVKGDAKIHAIMAASILAKTARDRFMDFCDRRWPEYGYAVHKGYPTAAHRQIIKEIGPSPIQRRTFRC